MQIKPASNNQLKLWKKLRKTKYRKKEGLFVAEGERCVEQIVNNGYVTIDSLVVEKGYQPGFSFDGNVAEVDVSGFSDLSDTDSPQGVLAVCETPGESAVGHIAGLNGVIVALDAVQDPGNVGTIIRTAAWFGAAGILYGGGTADPFHPKVVRSTAGATGALPYQKGEITELLESYEAEGWECLLMDGGPGADHLSNITSGENKVLVIGNEGNGISDNIFSAHRPRVKIPGSSQSVESLNAAIALGIGMYHLSEVTVFKR